MKLRKYIFTLSLFWCTHSIAQNEELLLNNDVYLRYEGSLNSLQSDFHTSIKPYLYSEAAKSVTFAQIDSIPAQLKPASDSWLSRKIFSEHLINYRDGLLYLIVDPILDETGGIEKPGGKIAGLNTRGFRITGNIGSKLLFSSGYYENALRPLTYQNNFVLNSTVVPGFGYARNLPHGEYDFGMAYGTLTWLPLSWLNIQAGHDKNFIGDGYRSLLLSDIAFEYPFVKILATWKNWRYQFLTMQLQDITEPHLYEQGYLTKNLSIHYLDWLAGKHFTIGFFAASLWGSDPHFKESDIVYVTPVPFASQAYSPNSGHNLAGLNLKYKFSSAILYSQLIADDPSKIVNLTHFSDYENRTGLQLGGKLYNAFFIEGLTINGEFNAVRPYTFQPVSTTLPPLSYSHYNQPLADPFGADFYEYVLLLNYRHKRFYTALKIIYEQGAIDANSSGNVGANVLSTNYTTYLPGTIYITQGVKSTVTYSEFRIGYVINTATNLVLETGYLSRTQETLNQITPDHLLYMGFRMNMSNIYFDF